MAFPRIGASDLRGIMAYPPTPAKPNAGDIHARDTVDLDETERMIKQLLRDGVDSIATNGTLGEMATLTLEEWKAFASVVVETVRAHDPDFRSSLEPRRSIPATRSIGCDFFAISVLQGFSLAGRCGRR
jgi:hypothetical protein